MPDDWSQMLAEYQRLLGSAPPPQAKEIAVSDAATVDDLLACLPRASEPPFSWQTHLGSLSSIPIILDETLPPGRVEVRDHDGKPMRVLLRIQDRWILVDTPPLIWPPEQQPVHVTYWAGPGELPRGLRVAQAWLNQIKAATGQEPDADTVKRVTDDCFRNRPCRDCGVDLGEAHIPGCDVPRCLQTGIQALQCDGYYEPSGRRVCDCADEDDDGYLVHVCGLEPHECDGQVWDGCWPGTEECVEYGLYSYFDSGWHPCGPEHPQGSPDLNVLHTGLATWDRERGRWVIEPQHLEYLKRRRER
jgi:hypothetical protein